MNISTLVSSVAASSQSDSIDAITTEVFKKALDANANAAMGLINAIPKPPNMPDHLGQTINTTAQASIMWPWVSYIIIAFALMWKIFSRNSYKPLPKTKRYKDAENESLNDELN